MEFRPEIPSPATSSAARLPNSRRLARSAPDRFRRRSADLRGRGLAANLNIHLHSLVLDGAYRRSTDGAPTFVEAGAPTDDDLHALLQTLIIRLMKQLTRRGVPVEETGQTYLAEPDAEGDACSGWQPWCSSHNCKANDRFTAVNLGS